MHGNKQRKSFLEMASGGLPYIKMLRNIINPLAPQLTL
jgi:hypothetical protein